MSFTNVEIEKAIHKSQHCQRNWDLSKSIPTEDLEVLKRAVTQCPSKQNIAFYRVHLIQKRDVIEKIHESTVGFTIFGEESSVLTTNPQTLANLLVAFEEIPTRMGTQEERTRNQQVRDICGENDSQKEIAKGILKRDQDIAIGIAAGYLNLTSNLLGYSTGCCSCFDGPAVKTILNAEGKIVLLMGVGVKNADVGRRIHHTNHDLIFPTLSKQKIDIIEV